jgi:hypothetical protein
LWEELLIEEGRIMNERDDPDEILEAMGYNEELYCENSKYA